MSSLLSSFLLDPYPFDVWIALRTDGIKGCGTLNDPYGVASAAQFDSLMNSLPENMRVHLGPGTFETLGYSEELPGIGWQPKLGMKIIGSGIDVTILKLAPNAQATNTHLFAVGHALSAAGEANSMDGLELSNLTVNCDVAGQTGSQVACGVARVMGNDVKIHRVKAIGWGTNHSSRPCLVFALITGTLVDSTVTEVRNCSLNKCIAIQPGSSAANSVVTVFHVGAKDNNGSFVEAYATGPSIHDCFVDCGSLPSSYEVRALSMNLCSQGVVQGNQIYNANIGGPYSENASTRDLIVQGNYFKNVLRGPYWKLGGLSPAPPADPYNLLYLYRDGTNPSIAVAISSVNPHNLQPGERMNMDASSGSPAEFKGFFIIKDLPLGVPQNYFRYQMQSAPPADASTGTMRKIFGIGRLIVADNVIELATSTTAAAIQIDDGNPASQTPDYVNGDVLIHGNKIRFIDGLLDSAYLGYGIDVSGAKTLNIRDNIIESIVANSIVHQRCGTVRYFDNRRPAGIIIAPPQPANDKFVEGLHVPSEDTFVLACFDKF